MQTVNTKQQTIFDQAEKAKQEGIELVYRHADSYWKKAASEQLLEVAQKQREFTSDDILVPLETRGVTTGDYRAIAAVLQAAARMGLIVGTERFVRCRRKSRHGAPIMVWRSNMRLRDAQS